MVKHVPLRSYKYPGMFALVDDEDFGLVMAHVWNVERRVCKHKPDIFYARRVPTLEEAKNRQRELTQRMHRLILDLEQEIDHIDGDGLNNCRSNLRPSTHAQNMANLKGSIPTKTSKYRGVHWDRKRNMWAAHICVHMKSINLGRFADEIEAAIARDEAAKHFHGEFASLNFQS